MKMGGLMAEDVPHSPFCLFLFLFSSACALGSGVSADAGQVDSREAAAEWSAQASPAEQFAQWVDLGHAWVGAGHVPSLQCPLELLFVCCKMQMGKCCFLWPELFHGRKYWLDNVFKTRGFPSHHQKSLGSQGTGTAAAPGPAGWGGERNQI